MSSSLLRATAERHRLVASTLSDPRDRAIVNRFADEVEDLGRLEVAVPVVRDGDGNPRCRELGFLFAKVYRPDPSLLFEELLDALEPDEHASIDTPAGMRALHELGYSRTLQGRDT